jgi:hypothetical protein
MVGSPPSSHVANMNDTNKPLTAAVIHSVYSGKKVSPVVEEAKGFQSTQRFARDPSHSGQAPERPKVEKDTRQR